MERRTLGEQGCCIFVDCLTETQHGSEFGHQRFSRGAAGFHENVNVREYDTFHPLCCINSTYVFGPIIFKQIAGHALYPDTRQELWTERQPGSCTYSFPSPQTRTTTTRKPSWPRSLSDCIVLMQAFVNACSRLATRIFMQIFVQLFNHACTHSLAHSFLHPSTDSFTYSVIHQSFLCFLPSLFLSFVPSIESPNHLSMHPFTPPLFPFIHSLTH